MALFMDDFRSVLFCLSAGMWVWYLCNKIKWPIEAALAVHVLTIFPFQNDMHFAYLVAIDLFAFGG